MIQSSCSHCTAYCIFKVCIRPNCQRHNVQMFSCELRFLQGVHRFIVRSIISLRNNAAPRGECHRQQPKSNSALLALKCDHEPPGAAVVSVLIEVNALPSSHSEAPLADRNGQGRSHQRGLFPRPNQSQPSYAMQTGRT